MYNSTARMIDGNTAALHAYMNQQDADELREERLQEIIAEAPIDADDYMDALTDFDAADLLMVALNNPAAIGSPRWVHDIIMQAQLDHNRATADADEFKAKRITKDFENGRYDE